MPGEACRERRAIKNRPWKAKSVDEKRALIGASLAQKCTYRDPLAEVSGEPEYYAAIEVRQADSIQLAGSA